MTHKSAWVFQDSKEVARVGKKNAAWSVGWREPDGTKTQKTCGKFSDGKKLAFRVKKQIEAELITDTYQSKRSVSWKEFVKQLEKDVFKPMNDENKRIYKNALKHFERIIKPRNMRSIKVGKIDTYVSKRSQERGLKKGSYVSPATINKELRCIKSMLGYAHDWGFISKPIIFKKRWAREPEKLPEYVTDEDFSAIYWACDAAKRPVISNISPTLWWRALLIMAYLTGWRIDELFSLKRKDLDLENATAITRHTDNKGKRDSKVSLHPMIIEHLEKIPSFDEFVFPWPHNRRQRWDEFHQIQTEAGINLPCDEDHEHNDSCHHYGFHDIRRAFATENAENLSSEELKQLMRHKSLATTQLYINMPKQLKPTTSGKLKTPTLSKKQAK